jgi:uncharacterized protein (TIGR02996 family)
MTDGEALLRAIRADPGDDLARLAYADWLDETGQDEARAEFIRTQIALAKLDAEGHGHGHPMPKGHIGGQMASAFCTKCDDHQWMTHRDTLLRHQHEQRWAADAFAGMIHWRPDNPDVVHEWTFGRGFIESVRCPLAVWMKDGNAILAAHPVRRVELSDREPDFYEYTTDTPGSRDYGWMMGASRDDQRASCVPKTIYRLLLQETAATGKRPWAKRHSTRQAAIDALSDACLAYARTKGTP